MRIRGLGRRLGANRGTSLVELALSILPWLILTFGIVEGGRLLFEYGVVSIATREGVRWAIVRGAESGRPASDTDIADYVQRLTMGLDVKVNVAWNPNNKPGSTVTVTVNRNFTPSVRLLTAATIPLQSSSQMVIAR